jgi:hypothetical protein
MIYNKNNLLVAGACGNEGRNELSGVEFKKDKTTATDGYILLQVKNSPEMMSLAKELPELPDKTKPLVNFANAGYLIPKKSVIKAMSNLKENNELPILSHCWFLQPKNLETSTIATTDLEKTDLVITKNISGHFPDISKIINQTGNIKSITIDVKKLKQVLDIIAKMSLADSGNIKISIAENNQPVKITAKTGSDQEITALVMPIKQ